MHAKCDDQSCCTHLLAHFGDARIRRAAVEGAGWSGARGHGKGNKWLMSSVPRNKLHPAQASTMMERRPAPEARECCCVLLALRVARPGHTSQTTHYAVRECQKVWDGAHLQSTSAFTVAVGRMSRRMAEGGKSRQHGD